MASLDERAEDICREFNCDPGANRVDCGICLRAASFAKDEINRTLDALAKDVRLLREDPLGRGAGPRQIRWNEAINSVLGYIDIHRPKDNPGEVE